MAQGLEIVAVSHVDEVLRLALTKELEPIDWSEPDVVATEPDPHAMGNDEPRAPIM